MTTSTGSWWGHPSSYSYGWEDCGSTGDTCTLIRGASSSSYIVQASDVGWLIRSVVTATNAGGSTTAQSSRTAAVTPMPPANTVPPSIITLADPAEVLGAAIGLEVNDVGSGMSAVVEAADAGASTAQQGDTLATSNGSWSNNPTGYSYQWQDCNSSGGSCSNITSATSSSYTVAAADENHTIDVVVTATNAGGSTIANSAATSLVPDPTPPAPINTALPTINGTAQQGDTLATSNGSWSNNPTGYSYQWQDCNSSGGSCSNITSATSSSYTVAAADENHTIDVVVTATNAGGSTIANSAATSLVPDPTPPAPINTALPTINGTAQQGDTLATSNGSWSNNPTGYSYQWQDCNSSGGSCSNITSATSSSYTVAAADENHTIDVVVTATNAGGSTIANSAATSLVPDPTPPAPINTALPTINGTAQQGDTLATSNGSWSNNPTGYSYQWQDCNSSGGSCSNITSATSSSYTLQASDVGDTIDVLVTATNAGGSNSAPAVKMGPVTGGSGGPAPSNTIAPYFTASTGYQNCTNGCAIVGQTLTVRPGTWTCSGGCGTLTYTYQWQDCKTTSGQPPSTGSCSNATGPGATSASYTVSSNDVGHALVPIVTAHNNGTAGTPTGLAGVGSTGLGSCSYGEIPWIPPGTAEVSSEPDAARPAGPIVAGPGCSPITAEVATTQAGELFCTNAVTTCGYGDPLAGSVGVPPGTALASVGSLSLGSGGCSSLGSPAWCTPHGSTSCPSTAPCVINGVSGTGSGSGILKVSGSGNYWTVENSMFVDAIDSNCAVCVGGGPLTMIDDTIAGVDNYTNEAQFAVYNTSGVTSNLTMTGIYVYNSERIVEDAGTLSDSFCYENSEAPGDHLECHHGCPGVNRGFYSTNNVYMQPQPQTTVFDGEDLGGYCGGTPGDGYNVNSRYDLLAGGDYSVYPASESAANCGTTAIEDDRFSRFYYTTAAQYGVDYFPTCGTTDTTSGTTTSETWTGNIWDDTGATVSP